MKMYEVYKLLNVEPVYGRGCYIYDKHDQAYLDMYGGHAVISIGHSHPHYISRIHAQLKKLAFYSNSVINSLQDEFAQKLSSISGLPQYELFMVNSGAEANENALKLASFYKDRTKIIALKGSFHGRTSAAINVTETGQLHQSKINKGITVAYFGIDDIAGITDAISSHQYAAVILESIQGIGGLNQVSIPALRAIRAECNQSDTIMICDEIQAGYGRSGKFYGYMDGDIKPDIVTMAKGMGNGFPVGGLLIDPIKMPAKTGRLGTTFGGNHLACAAALAVLEVIKEENLVENAAVVGAYFKNQLQAVKGVKQVKGRGLMLGAEFDFSIAALRERLVYHDHVFTGTSSNPNLLRLLPPLTITTKEVDLFIDKLQASLSIILKNIH